MRWRKWLAIGALRKVQLFRQLTALWFMLKDPRAPLGPKVLAFAVLAYALSPIDLIPDFIPVLGLLDDLINGSNVCFKFWNWTWNLRVGHASLCDFAVMGMHLLPCGLAAWGAVLFLQLN